MKRYQNKINRSNISDMLESKQNQKLKFARPNFSHPVCTYKMPLITVGVKVEEQNLLIDF